jgi:pimeloyl-ACP methyl ester carboxylesterase
MGRKLRRLGLAAGLGALGGLGASWWLGGRLTAPANAPVGPKPADLELEDVEFGDGAARVRGWFRRGERGRGAVVLLHPMSGDRRAMLDRARLLAAHGIGALAVDLRAHGETRGRRITFGLAEAEDAHAAVEYARERSANERIGAIGYSLGGASALLGRAPVAVDALVLEAVYPSLADAIEARIAMRLGRFAGRLLAPLFAAQVRPRLGAPLSALRPIEAIRRLASPVLVAGGARDPKTPFRQTERLFAAAPQPKELWRVEGAGHEDFLARDPAGYRERVLGFLRRYLG